MPSGNFLIIPEVTSERRIYIPLGFESPETLCSNLVKIVPDATRYHFGVLSSIMHMEWVRHTGGRLESRYRYSINLVYNNFPWPDNPSGKQSAAISSAADTVLAVREKFQGNSLADLYDPRTMPAELLNAHRVLDRAVDRAYRPQPFESERGRIEFLFRLYEEYTSPLLGKDKTRKRK